MTTQKQRDLEKQADNIIARAARKAKRERRNESHRRRSCPVCHTISNTYRYSITLPGTTKVLVFCRQQHLDQWKHEHPFFRPA